MASKAQSTYGTLTQNKLQIDAMVMIQSVYFSLWLAMSLIGGFALYTIDATIVTPTGWAHAVSHIGWWAIIEYWLSCIGHRATGYLLSYPKSERKLELSGVSTVNYDTFYLGFIAIAVVADVVHIVLTFFEMRDMESTFSITNWGFLIAVFVVYIVQLVLIKLPLAWFVYVHRSNHKRAIERIPLVFNMKSDAREAREDDDDSVANDNDDDTVTPAMDAANRMATSKGRTTRNKK